MNKNFLIMFLVFWAVVSISGCASVPKQVRAQGETIAFREAFEHEGAVSINGLLVKAEVPDKKEQKRLFAFDLDKKGITPVLITVTNKSQKSVMVEALSAQLGGKNSLGIEHVGGSLYEDAGGTVLFANLVSFGGASLGGGTQAIRNSEQMKNESIRIALYEKSFHQAIVAPGATAMGYLFFEGKKADQPETIELKAQNLDQVSYFDIQVDLIKGKK